MNIFPLISSPVSDLGTELPLAREVRWDFTKDEPASPSRADRCRK